MNKLKSLMLAACTFASVSAFASPYSDAVQNDVYVANHGGTANGIATANYNNDTSPDLYDIVNKMIGTSYTGNQDLDNRLIDADQFFIGDGSHSVMLAGMAAANVNSLGYYTDLGTGSARHELISDSSGFYTVDADGSHSNPFDASIFDINGTFGFYLSSEQYDSGDVIDFFSETALNGVDAGLDHMMSFSLNELNGQTYWVDTGAGLVEYTYENALLIGWEDRLINNGSSDDDYDDIMYLVDFRSTATVPAPAPLLLSALMLMLPLLRRRQK